VKCLIFADIVRFLRFKVFVLDDEGFTLVTQKFSKEGNVCMISGFHCGVNEVCALLGFC